MVSLFNTGNFRMRNTIDANFFFFFFPLCTALRTTLCFTLKNVILKMRCYQLLKASFIKFLARFLLLLQLRNTIDETVFSHTNGDRLFLPARDYKKF